MNPKFSPGQRVRVLHDWARDLQPRPVIDVRWDAGWNCYTYGLQNAAIRIEEHELEDADEQHRGARTGGC